MKYRLDEKTTVFSSTDKMSTIIAELQTGDEVDVGGVVKDGTEEWHDVTLSDGRAGYISAKTKGSRVGSASKTTVPSHLTDGKEDADTRKVLRPPSVVGPILVVAALAAANVSIAPSVKSILFIGICFLSVYGAYERGFNPWLWILASGIAIIALPYILVALSPLEAGITRDEAIKRRRKGDRVGVILSILTVVIPLVFYLVLHSL